MLLSQEAVLCTDSDPVFLCVTQRVPQPVHGSAGGACQIMLLSQEAVLCPGGDPVFLCITQHAPQPVLCSAGGACQVLLLNQEMELCTHGDFFIYFFGHSACAPTCMWAYWRALPCTRNGTLRWW